LLPDRRQAGAAATPTLFSEFFMLKNSCCLTAGRRAQQQPFIYFTGCVQPFFSSFSSLLRFLHVEKTLLRSSDSSNSQRILHIIIQCCAAATLHLLHRLRAALFFHFLHFFIFFMLKHVAAQLANPDATVRF